MVDYVSEEDLNAIQNCTLTDMLLSIMETNKKMELVVCNLTEMMLMEMNIR